MPARNWAEACGSRQATMVWFSSMAMVTPEIVRPYPGSLAQGRGAGSAAQGGLVLHVGQLLRIAYAVQPGDKAVLNAHRHNGVNLPVQPDDQCRVAIDLCRVQRRSGDDPAQPGRQQAGHLASPHYRSQDGLLDSATVTEENDIRSEDVEQALHVAGLGRPPERLERAAGRGR